MSHTAIASSILTDTTAANTTLHATHTIKLPTGDLKQPILVSGDRLVYVYENNVCAVDIYSGTELSASPLSGRTKKPDPGFPYVTQNDNPPLTVAAGAVFIVDQGKIQALELADGSSRSGWTPPSVSGVLSITGFAQEILVVENVWGTISVTAHSTADGDLAWAGKTGKGTSGTITLPGTPGPICPGNGAIFCVIDGDLYAINTDFGDTRFPKKTPAKSQNLSQDQAPLVGSEVVVCVGDGVQAFDIEKGQPLWSYPSSGGGTSWTTALSKDGQWMVAANAKGEVCALDMDAKGTLRWGPTQLSGVPQGTLGLTVANDLEIYVLGPGGDTLVVLDAATGKPLGGTLTVGTEVGSIGPVIDDGTVFVPTTGGNLECKPFGTTLAIYFDGTNQVAVTPPNPSPFAVGSGDFTLEAWIRSTPGGQILSAAPATGSDDTSGCGFFFEVDSEGRVKAVVFDDQQNIDMDLVESHPTPATDGDWHHVAVVRQEGELLTYVDGLSTHKGTLQFRGGKPKYQNGTALDDALGAYILDQLTPPAPPTPCAIGGQGPLSIGAPASAGTGLPFIGLLREVRVWDVAVSPKNLAQRMSQVMPPNVPHLVASWHLDEQPSQSKSGQWVLDDDVVADLRATSVYGGTPIQAPGQVTEIPLDYSAFPYPLEHQEVVWPAEGRPYGGFWAARGEHHLTTGPALSSGGTVSFGSENFLYGVHKLDGSRLWSLPLTGSCSSAVACGASFFALTSGAGIGLSGLIEIDALSGEAQEVPAFPTLALPTSEAASVPAPATSRSVLAAVSPKDQQLVVYDRAQQTPTTVSTGPQPDQLVIEDDVLYWTEVPSPGQVAIQWMVLDAEPAPSSKPIAADSSAFCVSGISLFYLAGGELSKSEPSQSSPPPTVAVSWDDATYGEVSGMAADTQGDLLLVSTSTGWLLGFSSTNLGQRWAVKIPQAESLFAPVISQKRGFVTSTTGVVAVVDASQGTLLGAFREPAGVRTAPVVEPGGTVYYGCQPMAETTLKGKTVERIDGALHSAVLGDTVALRLGLGLEGKDQGSGGDYASITCRGAKGEIDLTDGDHFCVEAWVNTIQGGEVVSIRPSAGGSGLGLSLNLKADGTIDFSSFHDRSAGKESEWQQVTASAKVPEVCDGSWHLVSVSYKGGKDVRIFVDAKPQTTTAQVASATPTETTPGLLAYLGAAIGPSSGGPGDFFEGFIGQVRLWNNSRYAGELSTYASVELRGDEPDLVACWQFDSYGVDDCSPNGYDGVLEGDAVFWLSDLEFDRPSYPYLQTANAKILTEGSSKTDTVYEFTLGAFQANGEPLVGVELELWTISYPNLPENGTVGIATRKKVAEKDITQLSPIPWNTTPSPTDGECYTATTNSLGQVTLQVSAPASAHGPSFKVNCPTFMKSNEFYSLNVLVDTQKLAKPVPPTLVAQAKLIQDYQWTTGGKVNSSRSIPTYRTVITALNGDRSPIAGESIEIWATRQTTLEVGGVQSRVNLQNSQSFQTNARGQLTVVIQADPDDSPLQASHLQVWAGFMNRKSRFLIDPSQNTHQQLSTVDSKALTTSKMVNYPTEQPLLSGDKASHATSIAQAVNHVMSVVQKPSGPSSTGTVAFAPPLGGGEAAAPGGSGSSASASGKVAMEQPLALPLGDQVSALRYPSSMKRKLPATADSFFELLQSQGYAGFSFDDQGNFELLHEKDIPQATPNHGGSNELFSLGSTVDGGLHDISQAGNDIYQGAKKVYVSAKKKAEEEAQKVTALVQTAENTLVEVVVSTVEDAVKLVEHFFKQLIDDLIDLLEFLMHAFDWKAILGAQKIVEQSLEAIAQRIASDVSDIAESELASLGSELSEALDDVFSNLAKLVGGQPGSQPAQQGNQSSPVNGNSVAAQWILSKLEQYAGDIFSAADFTDTSATPMTPTLPAPLVQFIDGLAELAPQLSQGSPAALAQGLDTLVEAIGQKTITTSLGDLYQVVAEFAGGLGDLLNALDSTIDVPFLGELYTWVTDGDELSFSSVYCLAVGGSVQVTYYTACGKDFYQAPGAQLLAQGTPNAVPGVMAEASDDETLGWGLGDNIAIEIFYLACQGIKTECTLISDGMFIAALDESEEMNPARSFFKIGSGLSGILSSSALFWCSTPYFVEQLDENGAGIRWDMVPVLEIRLKNYYAYKTILAYGLALIGDTITLVGGMWNLFALTEKAQEFLANAEEAYLLIKALLGYDISPVESDKPGWFDFIEFWFLLIRAVFSLLLIILDASVLYRLLDNPGKVARGTRNAAVKRLLKAMKCFLVRDISGNVAKLPAFLFTQTAAAYSLAILGTPGQPILYAGVLNVRAYANAAVLLMQGIGEVLYVQPPGTSTVTPGGAFEAGAQSRVRTL